MLDRILRPSWAVTLVLGAPLFAFACGAVAAPAPYALKTSGPKAAAVQPFLKELADFDAALDRNGGKAPLDGKKRVAQLQAAAVAARTELASFAKQLKAANEVQAFDAFIAAKVAESGSASLAEAHRKSGGGYAALTRAGADIDAAVVEASGVPGLAASDILLRVLGIGDANAGLKRGLCTFSMWVVTVGTSPDSAYKLCDRYST
jgi:hypothetical protein